MPSLESFHLVKWYWQEIIDLIKSGNRQLSWKGRHLIRILSPCLMEGPGTAMQIISCRISLTSISKLSQYLTTWEVNHCHKQHHHVCTPPRQTSPSPSPSPPVKSVGTESDITIQGRASPMESSTGAEQMPVVRRSKRVVKPPQRLIEQA